jgi:hypothetical protein
MIIPPYISFISDGRIFIQGDISGIIDTLNEMGLRKSKFNDTMEIPFDNSIKSLVLNEQFIHKFLRLIELDVCLARDFKQTYDPAYTAQLLKEKEITINKYSTISWDGYGDFHVEEFDDSE